MQIRDDLQIGLATHAGVVRKENHDAAGHASGAEPIRPGSKGHLFVVADGVGRDAAGGEASTFAVKGLTEAYFADPSEDPADSLHRSFDYVNRQIRALRRSGHGEVGASTCTALVMWGGFAWVGHVGDSRAYLIRDDRILGLTTDHTVSQEYGLDAEGASSGSARHILTRALGAADHLEVDISGPVEVRPDDAFLLCTDGLSLIETPILHRTVQSYEAQTACDRLVDLANRRGGRDNVTAVVVRNVDVRDTLLTVRKPRAASGADRAPRGAAASSAD